MIKEKLIELRNEYAEKDNFDLVSKLTNEINLIRDLNLNEEISDKEDIINYILKLNHKQRLSCYYCYYKNLKKPHLGFNVLNDKIGEYETIEDFYDLSNNDKISKDVEFIWNYSCLISDRENENANKVYDNIINEIKKSNNERKRILKAIKKNYIKITNPNYSIEKFSIFIAILLLNCVFYIFSILLSPYFLIGGVFFNLFNLIKEIKEKKFISKTKNNWIGSYLGFFKKILILFAILNIILFGLTFII